MAIIQTRAFAIKTIPFQDTSLIVRLFTESHGKVAVIAKGARNLKSPFRGYLEPLSLLEVQFYFKPTRDIQTLAKIETVQTYLYGCNDIQTTVMATAVLECLDKFIHEHHQDEPVFELVVQTLNYMDANRSDSAAALLYFLLKLTALMGYQINLDNCAVCGRSLQAACFNLAIGQLQCEHCGRADASALFIPAAGMEFLKKIVVPDIRNGLPQNSGNLPIGMIAKTLVNYLAIQMDLPTRFKSLELLNQIAATSA
ncbi:MAG: DNA repair protein RecO [Candidatus Neomarinimicrobiota bacterium]